MPVRISPVVLNIMIICGLIYFAQTLYPVIEEYLILQKLNVFGFHDSFDFNGRELFGFFLDHEGNRIPYGPAEFKPVQLVTALFSHGSLPHILFNMYALYMFGTLIETTLGSKRFLLLYLISGIGANILLTLFDPSPIPVVGASTAISGLIVAFAFYFPHQRLGIIFLPFQFRARSFVWGFAILSAVFIVYEIITHKGVGGISHFGHLMGMIVAFAFIHFEKIIKTIKGRR